MQFKGLTGGGDELSRASVDVDYGDISYLSVSKDDLDGLCRMAAMLCNTTVSLISVVRAGKESILSIHGMAGCDLAEMPVLKKVREGDGLLEMADGLPCNLRFFAGVPLITPDGRRIGALAVLHPAPVQLTEDHRSALNILSRAVVSYLETYRKNSRLEASLEKAEQFKHLFNSSSEIHCITNGEGTIEFINQSVFPILGFTPEEVLGQNIWDFSVPGERDRVMPGIYKKIEQGKNRFFIETRVKTKGGKIRWFSWYDVIQEGYWLVNGRDITDAKEAELQLETLSLAVEKSSVGVLLRDEQNRVIWMNPAFEQFFGYTLSDLRGKKFGHLLVGEETDRSVLRRAEEAIASKKPYQVEILLYRKDGSPVWMYLSNTPLYHDALPERWVCVAVDITEKKQAELALISTRDEAIRLSKAKENFLSVMSHEMRTPLNAVIGITDALLEESPKESQLENLEILKFSAQGLMTLINDVLDFTKIETGNLRLEFIPVDLRHLAKNTIQSFRYKAADKHIRLESDIDPGIPKFILGDSTRLYQILNNLLGNAVKFTEQGQVTLRLQVVEECEKNVSIKFEVADTGIGIPTEKHQVIFEAYEQAGSDTSRKYGGTGLGLAITKKLIELHQSQIFVKSEENKGSVFYFTLQFEKAAQAPVQPATASDVTFNAKVLLVDDNAMNRLIASKVLQKWGIKPDLAEDGAQALEKIKENCYDLVFMDIQMPVMDGIEAVKQIRAIKEEKYQKLPVIALTAAALSDEEEAFRQVGMNDYIMKPFDSQSILDKISPYLKKNE